MPTASMAAAPDRQEMKPVRPLVGARAATIYSAAVSAVRPPGGLYGASDTRTATASRFRWNPLESYGNDDEGTTTRVA